MEIIKEIPISNITPYDRNPRKNEEAIEEVAKSIKNLGYRTPIIVDENNIILAGHTRYKAIKSLGWETIPFIVKYTDLTEDKKDEYRIRDNKTSEIAEWDYNILMDDFSTEQLLDFGFNIKDLPQEEVIEDEAPPVPEIPRTVKGDIYQLGNHRVMCGDSTIITDVEKLMDGKKADMVFTDPPYNINFKPQRGTHNEIKNDNMTESDFNDFLNKSFSNCKIVLNADTYLVSFMGWSTIHNFRNVLVELFEIKSMPIWKKNNFGIGYYTRPQYEPMFLCLNGDPIKPENPPSDVFECAKVNKTIHSCEKPIGLIVEIIDRFNRNGLFYEPFCGSGSTLIACEQTNRICYGMELDEKYCDVIVQRYVNLTGGKVILNGQEVEWTKNIEGTKKNG